MKNRPMGNIPCLREIPLLSEPDSFQSSFNISCSPLPSHLQSILLSLCLSFFWEQLPLILKFQGQNIAKCSSRLQVDIVSLSLQRKKKILQNTKRKTKNNLKKSRSEILQRTTKWYCHHIYSQVPLSKPHPTPLHVTLTHTVCRYLLASVYTKALVE